MSEMMQLIDEARFDRDQARAQAQQWEYVATLLADRSNLVELRITKAQQKALDSRLEVEQMKAGALKLVLIPNEKEDDA